MSFVSPPYFQPWLEVLYALSCVFGRTTSFAACLRDIFLHLDTKGTGSPAYQSLSHLFRNDTPRTTRVLANATDVVISTVEHAGLP